MADTISGLKDSTIQRYKDVKPAYRRIYLTLQDAIMSGELPAEKKIPEDTLAAQLGVSRTPLRKAIAALKTDGIWKEDRNKTGVNRISRKDMGSLIDFDALLESHAAYLAARNGVSNEGIEILKELNETFRNVDESLRYDSVFEADLMGIRDTNLQFHLLIAKLSGNKYLYQSIAETRTNLRQYSSLEYSPSDYTPTIFYRDVIAVCHDEIIKALENGDPDAARAWMYTDAIRAKEKYFKSYKNPYITKR